MIKLSPDRGAQVGYGRSVDAWSLGAVFYVLLCALEPFDDEGLFEQILRGELASEHQEWQAAPPRATALIRRLMHTDPGRRLAAHEAVEHIDAQCGGVPDC